MLTFGQRKLVVDAAEHAGFDVTVVRTWTSTGLSVGSRFELDLFLRHHAPPGPMTAGSGVVLREHVFVDARKRWVSLPGGPEFRIDDWRMSGDGRRAGPVWVRVRSASSGELRAAVGPIGRVPPYARELRRGTEVELPGGRSVVVRRNGPRPIGALRRIDITGAGVAWRATGSWAGTRLVDLSSGQLLFRSHLDGYRISVPREAERTALLLLLVAAQIPQSLSPFFWKSSI
jgi:hypothetical protein